MARYLSTAWFEEIARHQSVTDGGRPVITLGQVVTGGPAGDVRYSVVVDECDGRTSARVSQDWSAPDVTFTADWATAVAVASGALSMQSALGSGRVRVGGDLGLLARRQSSVAGLDAIPGVVREATTWDLPAADDAAPAPTAPPAGLGRE